MEVDNLDGNFRFEEVYAGDLTVVARAEGYGAELVHVTLEENTAQDDVRLLLRAGHGLTGRVVDAEGSLPRNMSPLLWCA